MKPSAVLIQIGAQDGRKNVCLYIHVLMYFLIANLFPEHWISWKNTKKLKSRCINMLFKYIYTKKEVMILLQFKNY